MFSVSLNVELMYNLLSCNKLGNEADVNMVLTLRLKSLIYIWNIFAEFVKVGRKESWPSSLLNFTLWKYRVWKVHTIVMSCHVLHAVSRIWKKHVKTIENIINRKQNDMDDRHGIYVTREAESFFNISNRASHLWTYQPSCLTREINSITIFNVKPLNIIFLSACMYFTFCGIWKNCTTGNVSTIGTITLKLKGQMSTFELNGCFCTKWCSLICLVNTLY